MKGEATQDRINNRTHQHYQLWFTGDGAKTEFFLTKNIGRPEDVAVYVDGARMRPKDKGTAYDFQIRGHTPGYSGDKNAIKFTAAPANGVNVCVDIIST